VPSAGRAHCRSLGEGGGEGGPAAEQPPPPDVSAGRMSSPVIQTAPLEVGRSSSQSAWPLEWPAPHAGDRVD